MLGKKKIEKQERRAERLIFGTIIFCLFVSLVGVLISNKFLYCYGEDCDTYIEIEQVGACYKGCMFVTQPKHELTTEENQEVRIWQYDECSKMCFEYYANK